MYCDFVNYMSQFHPVWHLSDQMAPFVVELELPKKSVLIEKGSICNYAYFLNKGLMRAYYSVGDNEVTAWLTHEHQFVTAVQSFYTRTPSLETVESLESVQLYAVHYEDMMKFCYLYQDFALCMFKMMQAYNVLREMRTYLIRALKAQDRYAVLCQKDPDMVKRAPLKYVASYLDISQETLSRIRKQQSLEGVLVPNMDDEVIED